MTLNNQKQIETNMKQYYEILRSRQTQIIGIIKETSELLSRINSPKFSGNLKMTNRLVEKNLGDGMQLAFGMINALANILDEQINALNIWERLLLEEQATADLGSRVDCRIQDYYDINNQ
ncbi:MAG: hypothetical protein JSS81_00695 [Acidobacteria bacterium]|nr:hypothetical protein [Acidobacteriota bacterium]